MVWYHQQSPEKTSNRVTWLLGSFEEEIRKVLTKITIKMDEMNAKREGKRDISENLEK